jgi:chemotaxis family two-component system response regulator Rcp1
MSETAAAKCVEILLVEDNPADIELTRQGFLEAKVKHNLHVARDGKEALSFLRREGKFAKATRPDLILLDLNMPKMDGREVLRQIKTDDDLKSIPVVILTTSDATEDILKAYSLHANSYMTKPMDFDQFVTEVTKGVSDYWFTLVKLPPRE